MTAWLIGVLGAGAPAARAQEDLPAQAQPAPPALQLGLRVLQRRLSWPAASVVVVVPDEASFVDAVSRWSSELVFPVLIDNGTAWSGEAVARFVRAYGPERVLWHETEERAPEEPAARRAWVEAALARVHGASVEPTATVGLLEAMRRDGHTPPGVVVADVEDEAWVAALALAAGHGQPIVWVNRTAVGRVDGFLQEVPAERLVEQIETGCERTGLPWRDLGDAIDAVAICLNTPAALRAEWGENRAERFALTDLVGRHGAMTAGRLVNTPRWAWSAQIFGDAERAAYAAMCSLFLAPESAWLFDGYPSTEPWNQYDATAAAEQIRRSPITATVIDEPGNSGDDWRLAAARALDAGLVFVNTKGRAHFFDLGGGRAEFNDVPVLRVPAAVSFVHSWSAQKPANRGTIAGRWLERGAYGYIGSVHEPFLQAFLPTPAVALRLVAGLPWSAAPRPDGASPLWKITVLGDPLLTLGRSRPIVERLPDLPGAEALTDRLASAVAERRLAEAVRTLVLLGRDADAVELARAVRADAPASFDAELAEAVALAAFREANTELLTEAVRALGPARAEVSGAADALWLHAQPMLRGQITQDLADVLLLNLRDGTVVRDAMQLADAEARSRGASAANRVLDQAERLVSDAGEVQRLRRARR